MYLYEMGELSGSSLLFYRKISQKEGGQEGMGSKLQFDSCAEALERGEHLSREQWRLLLEEREPERIELIRERASALRDRIYGKKVYVRGLIEFTNYCKNDCLYCGIRRSNKNAARYRLTKEQILECCATGHSLGFRTFVLQGGEDPYFTDERLVDIVRAIKAGFPDCALTVSVGEREQESYRRLREAGADRYLLRHETANDAHYRSLHPEEMSPAHRKECLRSLKKLGFQTGAGFMVGSPGQTVDTLIDDLEFLRELKPEMVGIGPFIPHHDTPFKDEPQGELTLTLYLLSLIRLMLPQVLLPSTTALGTIHPKGRELGILAGANVVMPNLSPTGVRAKYLLYDNKICTGDEAAECIACMKRRMQSIGYEVAVDRGDHKSYQI